MSDGSNQYDVAIIGGGPAGSTCATLLKKYNPDLRVVILEKTRFPRDHIGESQLPSVSAILNEMGCWEKVEAAGFPIKIGATFTWGRDNEPWDLDFYPPELFKDEPRPARFEGQRLTTAFQVDRAMYDDILLRHAESTGVEVREQTNVERVPHDEDEIQGFELHDGKVVTARHYVDGSGAVGIVRRAMGVSSHAPKELRNIAIWDYWDNAEWAIRIGVGGTRIQVRSLPYGWLWFIPLSPTRTSVGLVCPASYYRDQGMAVSELYERAIQDEPDIRRLTLSGTRTGETQTIKDWSHCADRVVGRNWFLMGEAAGFADPILSAGMALAHGTAREVAYTILELERGQIDKGWLRNRYDSRTRIAIKQHIRFAQYWYSANARFTDLKQECQAIAKEAGVRLSPAQAWKWLAQGGFVNHSVRNLQMGSFSMSLARSLVGKFGGRRSLSLLEQYNVLKLNLHGAEKSQVGELHDGRIEVVECYRKGDAVLPLTAPFSGVITALEESTEMLEVCAILQRVIQAEVPPNRVNHVLNIHLEALEAMIHQGWVLGRVDKRKGFFKVDTSKDRQMRDHSAGLRAMGRNPDKPEP